MHLRTVGAASPIAHVEGIASFLFLGGACSGFCSLGCAVMACQYWQLIATGRLAGAGHVDRHCSPSWANRVWLATVALLQWWYWRWKAYDLRVYCAGSLEAAAYACRHFHTSN